MHEADHGSERKDHSKPAEAKAVNIEAVYRELEEVDVQDGQEVSDKHKKLGVIRYHSVETRKKLILQSLQDAFTSCKDTEAELIYLRVEEGLPLIEPYGHEMEWLERWAKDLAWKILQLKANLEHKYGQS